MQQVKAESTAGDILERGACGQAAAIAARELSCLELMTATLARIDRLNPRFNAIVALRDREALLTEARAHDARLARGEKPGPLFGLPMAVKDMEDVAGLPTAKGSPLLRDFVPAKDSVMVRRLREAGAIIIGKTNIPEFAFGSYSTNPVYGPTRNAYDEALSAGGSSSGASVAVALRMLSVADGSDYGGSLRNPAGWNNIYGLRPSFGRIPREDLDAWTVTMAVLGPMARNPEDLALLLSVQAGHDGVAPLSIPGDGAEFRGSLDSDLKGKRIAWVGDFGGAIPFEPGVLEVARSAMAVFEQLGCVVEDAVPEFDMAELWQAFVTLRNSHAAPALDFYRDPVKRALLPLSALYEVERGLGLSAFDVAAASQVRTRWTRAVSRFLERYDFWALPTAQLFAFPVETRWPAEVAGRPMGSYHEWMQCVVPGTMSGCPVIAVPGGFDERGRAMGVQIAGRDRGELDLLKLAHGYDRATRWPERRPPPALGG